MGYLRCSQDWDGDGKYDFFDRAMDVKNMELLQEQNKKVDEYQERLRRENSRPSKPIEKDEDNGKSTFGCACILISFFLSLFEALLPLRLAVFNLNITSKGALIFIYIVSYIVIQIANIYITFKLSDFIYDDNNNGQ
jgi:hypothetical protein